MPYSPPPSQQLPRFAPYVNNTSPPPSQDTMHSSPFNTSPTSPFSPHIPAPCRQLHPPKVPLYRPAVLRSIERPIRAAREPLTPPASSAASLNEVYIGDVEYKTGVDFRGFGYGNCAYSNVTDLGEIEDDDVQVTEEPDRGHWKPDAEAETCDAPICGNIFCYEHVGNTITLSKGARFHAQGYPSKACGNCFADYKRVLAAKRSDSLSSSTSSSSSSTLSNNIHPHSSPIVGIKGIGGRPGIESGLGAKVGSYVGSVPRDWSWSTF
ncbi:Zn finger protein [Maublancomyces gigas]|uniref:Zn finger protein n=1 Tax=Discina gigas TaxID=1032678 RepID=A0ABR3GHE0_9PEZI